jgi:hypothetical protein
VMESHIRERVDGGFIYMMVDGYRAVVVLRAGTFLVKSPYSDTRIDGARSRVCDLLGYTTNNAGCG